MAVSLTRRGRVTVLSSALTAMVGLGLTVGHASSLASSRPAPVQTVTVAAGETLWQIANQTDPDRDPRLVVADLESLNHLRGGAVVAGEQLVLPASG